MTVTVLVPMYNEARTIRNVLAALRRVPGISEIVVIDDGSTDGSAEIVQAEIRNGAGPLLRLVRHERNQGKGAAIRSGLAQATGGIVAIQDADLEYDPQELPALIEPIQRGEADVVFGSRFLRKNPTSHWRFLLGNKCLTFFINLLTGGRLTDSYTCYKIMPAGIMRSLELSSRGFELEAEISTKVVLNRFRIIERPIRYTPRSIQEGKKIRFRDAWKGVRTALACRCRRERPRGRDPKTAKKGTAFLVTALVLLAASEGYLRWKAWQEEREIASFRVPDVRLHHTLKPNIEAETRWGEARITYRTNSLGFRDTEIRTIDPKSPLPRRILFLGDSFVEGRGMEYEETFIHKLEIALHEAGTPAELLNGGVSDLAPSLEYLKLKAFLDGGHTADKVVLFVDVSDPKDEWLYRGWESRPLDPIRWTPKLFEFVQARLKTALRKDDGNLWTNPPERALWTESEELFEKWGREGIEICRENILKIAQLCKEKGMDFAFVIYPWPTQLQSPLQPSRQEAVFTELADRNGLRLINLFPDFRNLDDWRYFFIEGDCHWNELGHDVVANALRVHFVVEEVLKKRGAKWDRALP